MPYIFKQTIFILICLHYYCLSYNNFNELKSDMEMKVSRLTDAIQSIYADKCNVNNFQCPVKSFNVCDGTDQRKCIDSFPVAPSCHGVSKYSMTSGIRIPNSVASFNLSDEMKFFICKTAEIQVQSVLQQLIEQGDKKHGWITLASSLGVARISPGFKYEKQNATASCKNYDPRLRPWYSQSTYGRKKMIILIQNSKGIYDQPNRFASMQMSLQAVLKTSQPDDLFNIIQFSDSPRLFFSQKQMKLVSLNTQMLKFQKANNYSGLFYESIANNITKSKSIQANYQKALQLALNVFENSVTMNPQMENFILFFAGFKPTNLTIDYSSVMDRMLAQQQRQWSTNFLFFGFGVTMHDTQGTNILNSLACKYDGIYTELSDITYESMFVDQAEGYYDYLTQGNQIKGCRWTNLYEDAFGLGKMVSVIKPSYYQENNVSKLICLTTIDVLAKQLTTYMSYNDIQRNLQVTKLPFKKNISICVLQTIRKNYRCHKPQLFNCTVTQKCSIQINPLNQSVIRTSIDTSDIDCCIQEFQNFTGIIIGIVIGVIGAVFLIALAVYCLIFRKRKKDDLQKTYAEIFSQFKDFDRTRIRSDSEISIIKD